MVRVSSAASFALLFLPVYNAAPATYFWYHDYSAEASDSDEERIRVNVESTYAAQGPLLDYMTETLQDQRPGIADLYFLGFAGYADQDVFMKEVRSARALFDERFDTAGRSLALINNRQSVEEIPLASTTNLRRAFAALAERMDLEEDILFLFLTSHGSRRHVLSVDFWPLRLNRLPAQDLADLLDEAGIRNRVIAVSACYSGGFIEPLKNEHSLIMTASRADRNSFGCSNQREFTYFGQAYFNEQLRNGFDFVEAFEGAKERLAAWEADENLTPSEPQIHLGASIALRLEPLVQRLRNGAARQAQSLD